MSQMSLPATLWPHCLNPLSNYEMSKERQEAEKSKAFTEDYKQKAKYADALETFSSFGFFNVTRLLDWIENNDWKTFRMLDF